MCSVDRYGYHGPIKSTLFHLMCPKCGHQRLWERVDCHRDFRRSGPGVCVCGQSKMWVVTQREERR